MSGKTFRQKSKCLGLNRDFQANPGGVLSGEGDFGQKSKCLGLNRDIQANPGGVLSGKGVFVWRGVLSVYAAFLLKERVCEIK